MTPEAIAGVIAVACASTIVMFDIIRLYISRLNGPRTLGTLPDGGWGWKSNISQEFVRNGPSILTLFAMSILPWPMVRWSDTPYLIPAIWSLALIIHAFSLFFPRNYSATKTHLHVDGGSIEWSRLGRPHRPSQDRLVLQRKGWWKLAPLVLGGAQEDLNEVENRLPPSLSNAFQESE